MADLHRFFHFHHGTPHERGVKIVGSAIAAALIATTAASLTAIQAADHGARSDLHFTSHACPEPNAAPNAANAIAVSGGDVTISWMTTAPSQEDCVEYRPVTPDGQPTLPIRTCAASDGVRHAVQLRDIPPGRYAFRRSSSDGPSRVAISRTCAFTTP